MAVPTDGNDWDDADKPTTWAVGHIAVLTALDVASEGGCVLATALSAIHERIELTVVTVE